MTGLDWKRLLDKFSDKVKNGECSKIPYNDWKAIYTDKFSVKVKIMGVCNIEITLINPDVLEYYDPCYVIKNKSFYDFIESETLTLLSCAEAFKDISTSAETIVDSMNSVGNVYAVSSDTINSVLNNAIYDTIDSTSSSILNNATYDTVTTPTLCYGYTTSSTTAIKEGDYLPYTIYCSEEINEAKTENKKENENTMKFNIDFGPVSSNVRMSMYGMAVKNKAGNYVSYDKGADRLVDVDTFNFEGSKYLYKIPVAFKDIKTGDVIIHNGAPCFVKSLPDPQVKSYSVIDVYEGEMKEILIPVNMFGFNYATKVVNLLEGAFGAVPASEDNPFGGMLPMLLLSDGAKSEDMLPLMLMMSQNASGTNMFSNPMMMYLLAKGDKNIDPLMMMLMLPQSQPTCHCKDKK